MNRDYLRSRGPQRSSALSRAQVPRVAVVAAVTLASVCSGCKRNTAPAATLHAAASASAPAAGSASAAPSAGVPPAASRCRPVSGDGAHLLIGPGAPPASDEDEAVDLPFAPEI